MFAILLTLEWSFHSAPLVHEADEMDQKEHLISMFDLLPRKSQFYFWQRPDIIGCQQKRSCRVLCVIGLPGEEDWPRDVALPRQAFHAKSAQPIEKFVTDIDELGKDLLLLFRRCILLLETIGTILQASCFFYVPFSSWCSEDPIGRLATMD
ncbi:hypothetical protein P7K49_025359 [Saguinus oedipus]|uniref:Uncharacterized protein n=1 Tax=Saguinus oedipus TaxID=9490 RepID=A0ABQ9UHR5_SAGOE|nr:hypothetical protein P7K49_025359 [Saguinus oedipus]